MIPLAVDALAAFRLTRLVTSDKITAPVRDRVPPVTFAGQLVRCQWCAGIWVAFAVVAARRLVPRAWAPVGDALAIAAVVGIVADNA